MATSRGAEPSGLLRREGGHLTGPTCASPLLLGLEKPRSHEGPDLVQGARRIPRETLGYLLVGAGVSDKDARNISSTRG
ncbi:MAG TPA: hypothetical protein VNE42_10235 [Acidimicrobiales bacterium]|nr:hypothetical protein [Acidimicrobiales bacterium]